jgi:hypothetical protein
LGQWTLRILPRQPWGEESHGEAGIGGLQPGLPFRHREHPLAGHRHTPGPEQVLDPVLHPYRIADKVRIGFRPVPQRSELASLLVDSPLDRSDPELSGQTKGIQLVALRAPALAHPRHHDLLHVGREHLVQPARMRAFFQAQMPGARDPS